MKSCKIQAGFLPLLIGWLGVCDSAKAQNGLVREMYEPIFGGIPELMTVVATSSPTSVMLLTEFEAPQDVGSNYGQRVRGYVEPPVTGLFTFWVASDDQSILFLSSDENPANRQEIARVNGFTGFREWSNPGEPNQRSAPIALEAGKRYYIEALMVEGSGGDHLSVRWQWPDGTIEEPIPGTWLLAELVPPQIVRQPANARVVERETAQFDVGLSNLGSVALQWFRNGSAILGGTNSVLILPRVQVADDGARFHVVATNRFGVATSTTATLRVDRDVTPPAVLSVTDTGDSNFITVFFSEAIQPSSVINSGNFELEKRITVRNVDYDPAARRARLTLSGPIEGDQYRLSVTEVLDRGRPTVQSVALDPAGNTVMTVVFAQAVDPASAADARQYTVVNTIPVLGARLLPDGRTLILEAASLRAGASYQLIINGVLDTAAIPNPIEANSLAEFSVGYTAVDIDRLRGVVEPLNASSRRTALVISEIMYHPRTRPDGRDLEFVEIWNSGLVSENIGGYRLAGAIDFTFPDGAFIPAEEFVVVARVPEDVQLVAHDLSRVFGPYSGRLQNSAGNVLLFNKVGALLLEARYDSNPPWPAAADGIGHSLVLARPSYGEADPKAWALSDTVDGSPGRADAPRTSPYRTVMINEFLAHTDDPQVDFIELYNYGSQAVDLSGCILTDSIQERKFQIPPGTIIEPLGFLMFDQNELGFALSSAGETVYLLNPAATRAIDALRFGGQPNGVAMGRTPDGAPEIRSLRSPTPGSRNSPVKLPDVVINEIMYHPISGNDGDEYVELYNRSGSTVDVSGWSFTDGINFTIPAGVVLAPDSYLVIAKDVERLLAHYPHLNRINTVGGFGGQLSNGGERLRLSRFDEGIEIVVDEVDYRDGGRWGRWADGGGSSLELIDPHADNDYAVRWADSIESHKSEGLWTTIEHTGRLNHGRTNFLADDLHVILLGAGEALLDDVEVISAGLTNIVINGTFAAGLKEWAFQGNHAKSGLAPGAGFSGGDGLHLRASQRGDTAANRTRTRLSQAVPDGSIATLRAKARWLQGHPEVLLRLHGNYLEAAGELQVPKNLGSPGLVNSRRVPNAGPAIVDVLHWPIVPSANQSVEVTARILDTDGIGAARLLYRVDQATNVTNIVYSALPMKYRGAGVFSASIPGQTAGRVVAFAVEAVDATGGLTRFPAEAPLREALVLFGDTRMAGRIPTYRLWISQKTISEWTTRERGTNEELDSTFVYGEHRVIYNSGADYSGSPFHWGNYNSPVGNQANYVVVMPKDDLFLGQTDFVLNLPANIGNDNTAIREQTFYWMAKELGHPHTHRRFHHMFVNGFRRGNPTSGNLFEDAQQPNSDYVGQWSPDDPDGELYKIEDWFEFNDPATSFVNRDATLERFVTDGGVKKRARYRWNWRKRAVEGSASNYTNLFQLVDAVNLPAAFGPEAYTKAVESLVDVDEWMMAMALRHMVGDWDSYGYRRGKNMYAYKPDAGKWQLYHWDVAFAFGRGDSTTHNLFHVTHSDGTIDTVTERMFNHPPFRRAYLRAFEEIANGPMVAERVNPWLDLHYSALLNNGVQITGPQEIKTYIAARRNFILTQLAQVTAPFAITSNGGNDIRTNRNLVTLTGTAPVGVKTIVVNGVEYPVTWTGVTTWRLDYAAPRSGDNFLSVQGLNRHGEPLAGASDTIKVTYTSTAEAPEQALVINEIHYRPALPRTEFIELHNTSSRFAFDLSGYRLSGLDFSFAQGTVLAPGAFALLVQDSFAFQGAYGSFLPVVGTYGGRLANEGETIRLLRPDPFSDNEFVIDSVTYGAVPPWPVPGGTGGSLQLIDPLADNSRVGNWMIDGTRATPGATNSVFANVGPFPRLWVNEIQPVNLTGITDSAGDRHPWVELYNSGSTSIDLSGMHLTDTYTNLTRWAFPSGTSIAPGQYLVVWVDGEPEESTPSELHTSFSLASASGSIALTGVRNGKVVVFDYLNFSNVAASRSFGSFPDGQNEIRQRFFIATPGAPNDNTSAPVQLFINEWLASNTGTNPDPADGRYDDWFEIYNAGDSSVDLTDYTLTDRLDNPGKFRIPPGNVIGPNGFLLVWADENGSQNAPGSLHANFKLSQSGEAIGIFSPSGALIDSVTFGPQTNDVSQGRYPDGVEGDFVFFEQPTPGASNRLGTEPDLRVTGFTVDGPVITLEWAAEAGTVYRVEFKNALTDASWTLLEEVTATGDSASVSDSSALVQQRFYRVVQP